MRSSPTSSKEALLIQCLFHIHLNMVSAERAKRPPDMIAYVDPRLVFSLSEAIEAESTGDRETENRGLHISNRSYTLFLIHNNKHAVTF